MEQFVKEVNRLCREYQDDCMEAGKREKGKETRQRLERVCRDIRGMLDIVGPEVLLAVMDAYEVTRDEGMLQGVLDVVSGELKQLEVSPEAVKLLAYCYYYVEEEECAERAREMLEELRRRGENVTEAEKVLEELV